MEKSPVFERTYPLPSKSGFEKAYVFAGYITIAPLLLCKVFSQIERRFANTCPHDFHRRTTRRTDDLSSLLLLFEHDMRWHAQDTLQEFDEFFTAGMEKAITSCSLKAFW